jgi:hypothetical protein
VIHASGRFSEIVASLKVDAFIAEYVLTEELRSLDLRLPLAAGVISKLDLEGDDEAITALHYCTDPRMHTGEAVCAALAKHRDLVVATDDASAHSFFAERLPTVQLITSADIIRNWATSASTSDIRSAIRNITISDGYSPHKTHPLRAWWVSFLYLQCHR